MEYRHLGHSGLLVSAVGIGCNNFGSRASLEASTAVVHKALELGINLFDTADIYGPRGLSEEYLGKALGKRRREVVIATKFGSPMADDPFTRGASRRYIMTAVEVSLKRLNTDYIDLYQIHVPDPGTPIEETMRALNDLVQRGTVRYIGHSNFAGWQLTECHYVAQAKLLSPFVSAQNEYNLLHREIETELVPAAQAYGIGILPYFPLASGFLTGKYKKEAPLPEGARLTNNPAARERHLTERNWRLLDAFTAFAQSRGRSLTELSFAWLLTHPFISSVIAGATRPEQVEANVSAADQWRLSPDELAEVNSL